ncbi:MAG: type II secretion system F family protein [Ignavibacteriaceae bacterium]|nr:type II secretion system F family protein [Ignavibacteriaceae bacterium]
MVELKFSAERQNGQIITGTVSAASTSEGKKKIQKLIQQGSLKLLSTEKKTAYLYKVSKGNEKPIFGEQKAYNKKEVVDAFLKLGYKVYYVRAKLFDIAGKPPQQDILMFVRISAELMDQKLPYGEILAFLINDTNNKVLRETLKEINNDLKKGVDSEQTFLKYQSVFGKFTAFMLGLASKSGNMTEIYRATAKFLERKSEFRKNLKSALVTPFITILVLFGAVFFYITYIFPETAKLFKKFGIELPPMTKFTLDLSDFLLENPVLILAAVFIPIIAVVSFFSTERGQYLKDKYMFKIPIMGNLIHKTCIEVFCRVFYTLYSGSAESITPIRISAEATDNRYFEERIKKVSIPLMTKQGIGITEALAASQVLTETAISRIRGGEETGNIKNSMLQLANYYESETVYKLKNIIEVIQVFIALFIMIVMTLLTLVSAETATISPSQKKVEYRQEYFDKPDKEWLTPSSKLQIKSDTFS